MSTLPLAHTPEQKPPEPRSRNLPPGINYSGTAALQKRTVRVRVASGHNVNVTVSAVLRAVCGGELGQNSHHPVIEHVTPKLCRWTYCLLLLLQLSRESGATGQGDDWRSAT